MAKKKATKEKEARDSVDLKTDRFRFAGRKELLKDVGELVEYFKAGQDLAPAKVTIEPQVYQIIIKRATERYSVNSELRIHYGRSVLVPKVLNKASGSMQQTQL